MKVNRELLLQQLECVAPGLGSRDIAEQEHCFLFTGKRVMTYNDEITCSSPSCLHFSGAVYAKPLLALLRNLREDELDINQKKKDLIVKGRGKTAGIRIDGKVKVDLDPDDKPKSWARLPEDFTDAVNIVQHAAGKDVQMLGTTCICIEPNYLDAYDGYQCLRYRLKTGFPERMLIKRDSIKHTVTLGVIKFAVSENWVHFKNPNGVRFSCRRTDAEFHDLTKEFKGFKGSNLTLPKGLKSAAANAAIFSADNQDKDVSVKVELRPGKLRVAGIGGFGWYKERKKCDYKGRDISFTLTPDLLQEIVEKYTSAEISKTQLKVDGGRWRYITNLGVDKDGE